jgi:hypothetical protein
MARANTAGGGGGGGVGNAAAGAASAMAGLASKISPVGIALSALSAAGSLVSGVFDGLSSIVGKAAEAVGGVISGLVQFSKKAMDGTAKMSDLFAAFERLPFFIGEIASLFASLLRAGEQYLDVYRNLTKVGADFGGNLFQIQRQASRAHLTLGEFANIVNKNSDIFASMGGNVQSGINRFVELQNGLMKGAFRNQILGLGYSFEEAANATAGYMRSQGTMSKQGLENTSMVRAGVMQYAMELDALSKTTGKQREQIAKELQDLQMEEVWQNFVAQLSPNEAASARAAVNASLQYGGKEVARSMMLAIQGINVPINEATQSIDVATRGMLTTSNQQVVTALKAGARAEDILVMVARNNAAMGKEANRFQRSLGGVAGLLTQQGSQLTLSTGQLQYTFRNINDIMKALGQAQSGASKQASGSAVAFALAEDKVRQVGSALNEMWTTLVSRLSPNLIKLGDSILALIEKLLGSKGFERTLNSVINAFNDLMTSTSIKDFWGKLGNHLSDGFNSLWNWAKPVWENTIKPAALQMFEDLVSFLTPYMRKAFNFVFDSVSEYIYKSTGGRVGNAPFVNKEISREREYYESKRDELESQQRQLKRLMAEKVQDKDAINRLALRTEKTNLELIAIYNSINERKNTIPGYTRDPEIQKLFGDFKDPNKILTSPNGLSFQSGIESYLMDNKPFVTNERSLGTLGALGAPTEPTDVVAQIHQGERVLSQGEVGSLNSMGESLQRLNSLTAQSVIETKENNRHSRDILAAIKALGGNLFA